METELPLRKRVWFWMRTCRLGLAIHVLCGLPLAYRVRITGTLYHDNGQRLAIVGCAFALPANRLDS